MVNLSRGELLPHMLENRAQDAYTQAGVDISAGGEAVARYKQFLANWRHPDQLDAIGGFAGLFRLPGSSDRALVASTDGVGTKLLVAAELERYGTVGADLVNHCVNDILVANATPLFFLDYFATGALRPEIAADVVQGCAAACRAHDCALLGGETAEMPGLYAPGHFDLAGTIVGVVDVATIPDPKSVVAGDAVVGLPAIGLHTNGYSLARKLIARDEWQVPFDGGTFGDALLAPHPSYYEAVRSIQRVARVKVMAHITGGGLLENVVRTLPPSVKAVFEQQRWNVPALEREIVRRGALSFKERYRTLNMGIGYTLVVPLDDAARAMGAAPGSFVAGWIEARADGEPQVVIHPARGDL
jgi:phosphoribosylformylglycinamidine cyclo-ligase